MGRKILTVVYFEKTTEAYLRLSYDYLQWNKVRQFRTNEMATFPSKIWSLYVILPKLSGMINSNVIRLSNRSYELRLAALFL